MNEISVRKFKREIEQDKRQFYKYVDNVKYLVSKIPMTIALRLSEDWKTHESTAQMLVDMTDTERIEWVLIHGAAWLRETERKAESKPSGEYCDTCLAQKHNNTAACVECPHN